MSPKERVTAQIQHIETDPVPYTLGFEGDVDLALDVYYGSTDWRSKLRSAIVRIPIPMTGLQVDIEEGVEIAEREQYSDAYGSLWRMDCRPFHLEAPILKEPSLDDLHLPAPQSLFPDSWKTMARGFIEQYHDRFVVGAYGYGLFERSWTLRGFENMLMDCVIEEDFYDELLEVLTEHHLDLIDQILELPVDGILLSDDWGYQHGVLIGAERWRKMLKPRLARLYQRVHDAGKIALNHCCGSVAEIMPDLIEIGLDVLESVQPEAAGMNPYELKKRYGKHITFWGGLGSQSIIPFGTPGELTAEIDKLAREMSVGGGYILAPAKDLQPGTPVENAAAIVEAFIDLSD